MDTKNKNKDVVLYINLIPLVIPTVLVVTLSILIKVIAKYFILN